MYSFLKAFLVLMKLLQISSQTFYQYWIHLFLSYKTTIKYWICYSLD